MCARALLACESENPILTLIKGVEGWGGQSSLGGRIHVRVWLRGWRRGGVCVGVT